LLQSDGVVDPFLPIPQRNVEAVGQTGRANNWSVVFRSVFWGSLFQDDRLSPKLIAQSS
jgi:hypothetical protein